MVDWLIINSIYKNQFSKFNKILFLTLRFDFINT